MDRLNAYVKAVKISDRSEARDSAEYVSGLLRRSYDTQDGCFSYLAESYVLGAVALTSPYMNIATNTNQTLIYKTIDLIKEGGLVLLTPTKRAELGNFYFAKTQSGNYGLRAAFDPSTKRAAVDPFLYPLDLAQSLNHVLWSECTHKDIGLNSTSKSHAPMEMVLDQDLYSIDGAYSKINQAYFNKAALDLESSNSAHDSNCDLPSWDADPNLKERGVKDESGGRVKE